MFSFVFWVKPVWLCVCLRYQLYMEMRGAHERAHERAHEHASLMEMRCSPSFIVDLNAEYIERRFMPALVRKRLFWCC